MQCHFYSFHSNVASSSSAVPFCHSPVARPSVRPFGLSSSPPNPSDAHFHLFSFFFVQPYYPVCTYILYLFIYIREGGGWSDGQNENNKTILKNVAEI